MKIPFGAVPAAASASSPPPAAPQPVAPTPREEGPGRVALVHAQAASNADAIKQVADQINAFLKTRASDLQFSVDPQSDQVVVRIVDTATGEVIRQIPSEEMIAISHALDRADGLLLHQKE